VTLCVSLNPVITTLLHLPCCTVSSLCSIYIFYLVAFSPDLTYFHWTWPSHLGEGLSSLFHFPDSNFIFLTMIILGDPYPHLSTSNVIRKNSYSFWPVLSSALALVSGLTIPLTSLLKSQSPPHFRCPLRQPLPQWTTSPLHLYCHPLPKRSVAQSESRVMYTKSWVFFFLVQGSLEEEPSAIWWGATVGSTLSRITGLQKILHMKQTCCCRFKALRGCHLLSTTGKSRLWMVLLRRRRGIERSILEARWRPSALMFAW